MFPFFLWFRYFSIPPGKFRTLKAKKKEGKKENKENYEADKYIGNEGNKEGSDAKEAVNVPPDLDEPDRMVAFSQLTNSQGELETMYR